jgi:hypothetical protein
VTSQLDDALRQFEAAEANLVKLERLWSKIEKLIPSGISFADTSPEARAYEDHCRAFRNILPHVPALDGLRITDELLDLDEIAQSRLDAKEVDEFECFVAVERSIVSQGPILRDYRFKLNSERRRLVRNAVQDLVATIAPQLETLKAALPAMNDNRPVEHPAWTELKASVKQLDILMGNSFPRPKRWSYLHRHLSFGMTCDLGDIIKNDWPDVESDITASLYSENDPVPVEVEDLGTLVKGRPSGPVATSLNWKELTPEDFERLVFCLISDARGYENPQWLTHTNAPDLGRDLSVLRTFDDALGGPRQNRVIFQCKHWLSKSVGAQDVSLARDQIALWEPPSVDTLVIVTSGRFTTDAVQLVEKHNAERKVPSIEMWADSHLERLLAERPHLIAEFNLR